MKLRLKGNSLRLRVTRSELARLLAGERIEESTAFPGAPAATLRYVLESGRGDEPVQVSFAAQQILVGVSKDQLMSWSGEDQVGIYAVLPSAENASLEVAIEKDFTCLDHSDADNEDAFANPMAGKAC